MWRNCCRPEVHRDRVVMRQDAGHFRFLHHSPGGSGQEDKSGVQSSQSDQEDCQPQGDL